MIKLNQLMRWSKPLKKENGDSNSKFDAAVQKLSNIFFLTYRKLNEKIANICPFLISWIFDFSSLFLMLRRNELSFKNGIRLELKLIVSDFDFAK